MIRVMLSVREDVSLHTLSGVLRRADPDFQTFEIEEMERVD